MWDSVDKPYKRPSLCRLCEGPVADGGVWMAELDLEKLRRWWLREFGTELDDDLDTLDDLCTSYICQFCVWDARHKDDEDARLGTETRSEPCDWWTDHDSNDYYKAYYYEVRMIRPCEVKMSPLQLPTPKLSSQNIKVERNGAIIGRQERFNGRKPTYCIYCREFFKSKREAFQHVAATHKNIKTVVCRGCEIHFNCSREKADHIQNVHLKVKCPKCLKAMQKGGLQRHLITCNVKKEFSEHSQKGCAQLKRGLTKCIYCEKNMSVVGLSRHMRRFHNAIQIRCIYPACQTFFKTLAEKNVHVQVVHESQAGLVQCPHCPLMFGKKTIRNHFLKMHTAHAIKCTVKQCSRESRIFCSEEERDQHIEEFHKGTEFPCIYSDFITKNKVNLRMHVRTYHKSEIIRCKIAKCTELFLSEADLETHLAEKHGDEISKMVHVCEECDFASKHLWGLKFHVMHKHSNQKYPCQLCSNVLKSEFSLYRHQEKAHNLHHMCEHCNSRVKLIRSHLRLGPCKKCGDRMPCRNMMAAHAKKCSQ